MFPHYQPPPPPPDIYREYRLSAASQREAAISEALLTRLRDKYIFDQEHSAGKGDIPRNEVNLCPRITGFTCTLGHQTLEVKGNKKSGLVLNYDGIAKNIGAYCGENLSREELEELSLYLAIRGKKARVFSGIGTWARYYSPEGDRISGKEGYLALPVDEFGMVTISLTEGNATTLSFPAVMIEEIILGDEAQGLYLQDGAKYHEFINEPPLCAGVIVPSGLAALMHRLRKSRNRRGKNKAGFPYDTKGIRPKNENPRRR